jgi:uncharacterized SAM-binding protein YcdF (DUF218 family)
MPRMPRHVSERWSEYLGPGALPSFTFAALLALLGLGIPLLWRLLEVLRIARRVEVEPADAIVVLGRALVDDRPTDVFRARLEHGADLLRGGLAPRIVVTGGLTGCATLTEAAAGRDYLETLGIPPAAVICEDRSRHTLENLYHTRSTLRANGWDRVLVVSDPLHLARVTALGRGLGLALRASPAIAAAPPGWRWWSRAAREAALLHWYHCGILWSRLTRNRTYLARVT